MKTRPLAVMTGPPIVIEPQDFGHVEAPLLHLAEGHVPEPVAGLQVVGGHRAVGRLPAGHAERVEEGRELDAVGGAGHRRRSRRSRGAARGRRVVVGARDQPVDLHRARVVDDEDAGRGIDRAAAPFDAADGGRDRRGVPSRLGGVKEPS